MWKRSLAVLPGIGVSLLPKLACPVCYPAYTGLVSALGLGFLISAKYLLPLTVAFLAVAAAALSFRASRRHGYGPFWLGLVAAAVILTGKFYFDAAQAAYAGVGLLIAASVWNSWPHRAVITPVCPACVPTGAGFNERNARGEPIHETQN
jgi:mercuric ion transport protein